MQTICVQKCKLGSTEYYLAKMPAGELVDTVGLAAEMPEWEGMTADEKEIAEKLLNCTTLDEAIHVITATVRARKLQIDKITNTNIKINIL